MSVDLLLTGFEPFGGDADNPSWEAARRALPALAELGIDAVARELPVEFERAGTLLAAAVRDLRPRVVIATGLAAGRTAITPERVAINVRDARIPDNAGAQPVDEPVVPDGPAAYFSTLPIKAMVAAVTAGTTGPAAAGGAGTTGSAAIGTAAPGSAGGGTEAGAAPAAVSQTAGTYVCNDVFFAVQHLLATDPELAGIRGGFVHVPSADVVAVDDAARALALMGKTALMVDDDARLPGGAEF